MILLNAYPYGERPPAGGAGRTFAAAAGVLALAAGGVLGLVDVACDLMERTLNPQGINMGINQGRAAGRACPSTCTPHLVPRWGGDTNFITVIGQVRIVPALLEPMWQRYRQTVKSLGLVDAASRA
jgi:ATP adenylyltransferase